jgi:hypothetical protein
MELTVSRTEGSANYGKGQANRNKLPFVPVEGDLVRVRCGKHDGLVPISATDVHPLPKKEPDSRAELTEWLTEHGVSDSELVPDGQSHAREVLEKLKQEVTKHIQEHTVSIGMTAEECRSALGYPVQKNKTTTASGTSEQWVYSGNRFLYFEAGILTTVQH